MRVLFDGSDLNGPRTGVFWTTYNLLLHLFPRIEAEAGRGSLQVLRYRRPFEPQPFPRELSGLVDIHNFEPVSFRFLPVPPNGKTGMPLAGLHYLVNMLAWPATKGLGRLPTRVPDGIDIYHCSDGLLLKGGSARKVVTVHDLVPFLFPRYQTMANRWYHRRKLNYVLHWADRIIAVSENTRRDLVQLFNVEPDRIRVIHNGCDPLFRPSPQGPEMDALRRALGLEEPYILCVSTLEPRKNLKRLLNGFAILTEQPQYRDLTLVLVGARGWKSRRLETMLHKGRSKGLIPLQDIPRKVLPSIYSGAEVFVYPSLYEGFGLPVLEAMACGSPVVAARSSALPEVVGEAGLFFNPRSVEEMVDRIRIVLEDSTLRQKMVEEGLDRARLFSWEKTARKVVGVYRELLER